MRKEKEYCKRAIVKIIKLLASTPLPTEYGDFTYMVFGDYATGEFHNAVIYGNAKKSIAPKFYKTL